VAWYRYRARDAQGSWFSSTVEADSAYEATIAVREMGVELEALERVSGPEVRDEPSSTASAAPAVPPVASAWKPDYRLPESCRSGSPALPAGSC